MSTTVKVNMKPINVIVSRLGVNKSGAVQKFVTNTINLRITRYMPYRSSALSTKLKRVISPTEIEVSGPYARYQYYGKVMADPVTGAAGFLDKDGQWKSRRNVPKVKTNRDLDYTQSKGHNPRAGPFWDRHLMAAEGKQIAAIVQNHISRGTGK